MIKTHLLTLSYFRSFFLRVHLSHLSNKGQSCVLCNRSKKRHHFAWNEFTHDRKEKEKSNPIQRLWPSLLTNSSTIKEPEWFLRRVDLVSDLSFSHEVLENESEEIIWSREKREGTDSFFKTWWRVISLQTKISVKQESKVMHIA